MSIIDSMLLSTFEVACIVLVSIAVVLVVAVRLAIIVSVSLLHWMVSVATTLSLLGFACGILRHDLGLFIAFQILAFIALAIAVFLIDREARRINSPDGRRLFWKKY